MEVLINNERVNLIQYKNNPNFWWDGIDESKVYSFSELKFPTTAQEVTQTVAKVSVKTNVNCSIKKRFKK